MANFDAENKRLEDKVKRLEEEATDYFNSLIAYFVLVGDLDKTKSEKMALINTRSKKAKNWINEFVNKNLPKLYSRETKVAYKQIEKRAKALTTAQTIEVNNLRSDLINSLNASLDKYYRQARKLILIRDLERIRNEQLNYENYQEKRVIKRTKFKKEIVLMDSKGRRIKANAIMAIVVGDAMFKAGYSARNSVWLLNGFKYGIHISVIDDRTTDICLQLNGVKRNLRKDKLPPLHPRCRSHIEPINT